MPMHFSSLPCVLHSRPSRSPSPNHPAR
jgi:hypothetical protein